MNKVFPNSDAAVADIPDGSTLMLGGFGLAGMPENLIRALVRRGVKGLHTISNNLGVDGVGSGVMLEAGMIDSHIGSYAGENKLLESMVLAGKLKLTLIPQGTLAERMRAGGAGIPAFYTRPVWERWWRMAKRCASSTAAAICWNARLGRISRW
jgi:3-oxoacid CoA-transferase subunit A